MNPDQTTEAPGPAVRAGSAPQTSLETQLKEPAARLRDAVRAVVEEVLRDETCQQQAGFMQALKLSQPVASRVLASIRLSDPLASVQAMPGGQGLRQVLRGASRFGVDRANVRTAESAARSFEHLVRQEIGDRSSLDAVLSSWVPETRKKFELAHKRATFKAFSKLKGVMANVFLSSTLLHPSHDSARYDVLTINGFMGLRRLRPGVAVRFLDSFVCPELTAGMKDGAARATLNGKPVEGGRGVFLEQLCSSPLPELDIQRAGDTVHYFLGGNALGRNSAVDVCMAEVGRGRMAAYLPPGEEPRKTGVGAEIEQPVKKLIFDLLLHRDVWPGSDPELLIYDTIVRGLARPHDPARRFDLLDTTESIQFMGEGVACFRMSEVAGYLDALRHCCGELGWDPDKFRGYRCSIDYPVYGSETCMCLDLPPPPE